LKRPVTLCATPTDLRKSFDSLAALVRQALDGDPLSGHLYVFPPSADGKGVEVRSAELAMLLDGVELDSVRRRRRYRRPAEPA
jgi:transposase